MNRCEHCGRGLKDETKTVWLELSFKTRRWYPAHQCPPEESNGHFPFGEDCARKILGEDWDDGQMAGCC